MKIQNICKAAATLVALALGSVPAMNASAQKADFSGQRVEIIVPFGPGGAPQPSSTSPAKRPSPSGRSAVARSKSVAGASCSI